MTSVYLPAARCPLPPDTRRNHLDKLSSKLKLRGTVIDGEIFASDDNATLPHWVELRRQP
jgi:ATP-dependent DNA ligase